MVTGNRCAAALLLLGLLPFLYAFRHSDKVSSSAGEQACNKYSGTIDNCPKCVSHKHGRTLGFGGVRCYFDADTNECHKVTVDLFPPLNYSTTETEVVSIGKAQYSRQQQIIVQAYRCNGGVGRLERNLARQTLKAWQWKVADIAPMCAKKETLRKHLCEELPNYVFMKFEGFEPCTADFSKSVDYCKGKQVLYANQLEFQMDFRCSSPLLPKEKLDFTYFMDGNSFKAFLLAGTDRVWLPGLMANGRPQLKKDLASINPVGRWMLSKGDGNEIIGFELNGENISRPNGLQATPWGLEIYNKGAPDESGEVHLGLFINLTLIEESLCMYALAPPPG